MDLVLSAEDYVAQAKAKTDELLMSVGHDLGQVQMHLRPVVEGYQPSPREMDGAASAADTPTPYARPIQ